MTNFDYSKFFGSDLYNAFPATNSFPFDTDSILELQRKNFQAFTEAQQLAMEGMQAVAQRQTEILSQIVEDNSKLAKEIITEGSPEQKVAKQADLAKKVYERSVSHCRELANMVGKSSQEATDIINKRVSASLTEVKSILEKANAPAPKKAA